MLLERDAGKSCGFPCGVARPSGPLSLTSLKQMGLETVYGELTSSIFQIRHDPPNSRKW